jgi:hypothetical protein
MLGRYKYIQLSHWYLIPALLSLKLLLRILKGMPGSDGISAQPIQARDEILRSKIHKLIKSIWKKEELPDQ